MATVTNQRHIGIYLQQQQSRLMITVIANTKAIVQMRMAVASANFQRMKFLVLLQTTTTHNRILEVAW